MKYLILGLLLLATPLGAAEMKQSSAGNFSIDLQGVPDTRPNTWGTQGAYVFPLQFTIPVGQKIRILRVYGDFVVFANGNPPPGTNSGTLLSMHTSNPDIAVTSVSSYLADNCFFYIQQALSQKPERAPFDTTIDAGGLLGDEHTLYVKVAVWLNNTGLAIHMEPTFVIVFQLEDVDGKPLVSAKVKVTKGRPAPALFAK